MTAFIPLDEQKLGKLGPRTLIVGILLVFIGTVGVMLPWTMSLVTSIYIAALLLTGGLFWAYHTLKSHPGSFMGWLKPFLLIVTGGLMLYYPLSGVAAVGIMFSFYLFFDAFGSFALAREIHPAKGWGWMTFNGVVSLLLAVLILIGWPATSMVLVGIFVGVSLIFDGWALIIMGWHLRNRTRLASKLP